MKHAPKALVLAALFIGFLSIVPVGVGAAQRAITASSLEKSYEAQSALYDAQIAQADKEYATATSTALRLGALGRKGKILDNKRMLEVSYELLSGALK